MKKHLKWIIPLCAVILLAAAGLTAFFLLRPQEKAVPADVKLYVNVNGYEYHGKPGEVPVRPLDDDGYYSVQFAGNGEQVRYLVTPEVMRKGLDMHEIVGLVVDENGVVTDFYPVEDCTGGFFCKDYFVQSIEGNTVTCNSGAMYNGFSISFELTEDVKVYRMDGASPLTGMPTQISVDDEITAIQDENGKVFMVFVTPLQEIPDIYWNVTRMYNSTTQMTTRESDALGYYTFEMALNGELTTVRTRDMSVANAMDKIAARNMYLTFDEEGLVISAVDGSRGTGGWVASWCDTTLLDGRTMEFTRTIGGSNQGTVYRCTAANNFVAYDVSGGDGEYGAVTELRLGDRVHCLTNKRGQVCIAYVVNRIVDSEMYWNVTRRYDSTEKATTRHVKADGYYHVLVAVNGQQKWVRIKDRKLVNTIDARADKHFGLKLNGDIVEKVYSPSQCTGGTFFASWCDVTKIEDGTVTAVRTIESSNYGSVYTAKMAPDCKIYNVTGAATVVGEVTDLRVGDRIHGETNYEGELVVIYVVDHRTVAGAKVYWNVNRMYNGTTKLSTRKPDADGWYTFLLACDGEQVTAKTKDASIVQSMDAKADRYFGLKVNKDGVITKYMSPNVVTGGTYFASWCDVVKIDGDYVTAERTIGGSNQGKQYRAKMQKDVKVYNVSDNYINFAGEETDLRVGDRIQGQSNIYGGLAIIYVVYRPDIPGEPDHFHCACNGNHVGVGDHTCDDQTGWSAWINPRRLPTSGNWYLTCDVVTTGTVTVPVGSSLRICLNGHNISNANSTGGSVFGVNTELTITDCSAESNWGTITGHNDTYGTMMYVYENKAPATVNIFAGHLKGELDAPKTKDGGLIYIGSNAANTATFNMYGGTLTGVDVDQKTGGVINLVHKNIVNIYGGTIYGGNAKYGGAIYIGNGTVNVLGGTIDGGTAYNGGAIYVKNGTLNVHSGAIQNGYATFDGGNVYGEAGAINVYGGTISGGVAANEGGNIRNNKAIPINIFGGTVKDGGRKDGVTVTKKGGNIMNFGTLTIDGGSILNGKAKNAGGNISTWGSSSKVILKSGSVENGGASSGSNMFLSNSTAKSQLEISGGLITKGGNIHLDHADCVMTGGTVADGFTVSGQSTVTLSGAPVIAGRHDYNLQLKNNNMVTVGDLTDGAKIYVTLANDGGAFAQLEDPNDKTYFFSDKKEMEVTMDTENKLYIQGKHTHCVCGGHYDDHSCGNVSFSEWTGTTSLPTSGNYYLTADVTLSSGLTIPVGSDLKLCLNGHTITKNGSGSVFYLHGTLSVTDCSAEDKWGSVIGDKDTYGNIAYLYESQAASVFNIYAGNFSSKLSAQTKDGGLIYVGNQGARKATLNLYNGKLTGVNVGNANGGVVNIIKGSVMNMYGGTVTGGKAIQGGGIRLVNNSVFNMYGGVIEGNTATATSNSKGGGVYAANTAIVNLYGGTIQKNRSEFDGGGVYIIDTAVLNIYQGATITNNTTRNEGGNVRDNPYTTINMYGGEMSSGSAGSGGNLMMFGTLNMYSGTIKDGKATNMGGNINTWSNPKINLVKKDGYDTAPVISGGSAKNGGSIYLRGTAPALKVTFGSITGGTASSGGNGVYATKGTVTVGGTAVIETLHLSGSTVSAEAFTGEASIGIIMSTPGSFLSTTTDLTAYFKAVDSAYEVIHDGSNMVLKKK